MADTFYLTRSPNAHVRLAALQRYNIGARQRGGTIFGRSNYLLSGLTPPEDIVGSGPWANKRALTLARQRGSGMRRSGVVVRAVGKRWGRAPRQYAVRGQRGAGYAAIAKMIAKPALSVLAPLAIKAAAGGVKKLVNKRRRQKGGSIKKLGANLVSSPEFRNMLRRPLKQALQLADTYGNKGIRLAQNALTSHLQKGGSLKSVATKQGKIFAGNLMADAVDVLMKPSTKQFVRGMVKKKMPLFKNTAANAVWKATSAGLRGARKQGRKMAVGAMLQKGGSLGIAGSVLGKVLLPRMGAALVEPLAKGALSGILKMVGGSQRGGMYTKKRRLSRKMIMDRRLMRAALQRGGRGNRSTTNKAIQQALVPATKSSTAAVVPALTMPASKKAAKKTAGSMFNRILNSNALTTFGNKFAGRASDAILAKVFD